MRVSRSIFAVLAILMLSACGTVHDDPAQHSDISNWLNSRPSQIGDRTFDLPAGYSGQHMPPRKFDAAEGSVTVYPVDDDMPPLPPAQHAEVMPAPVTETPVYSNPYGRVAQEVYFEHGMYSLSTGGKQTIHSFAEGVKAGGAPLSVTVVGHASTRVDTTDDPVRRKMINFEIAQKRASAVSRELGRAGVNPDWVQAVSKGDEEPNPNPGGMSQEAADRRVQIYTNTK